MSHVIQAEQYQPPPLWQFRSRCQHNVNKQWSEGKQLDFLTSVAGNPKRVQIRESGKSVSVEGQDMKRVPPC